MKTHRLPFDVSLRSAQNDGKIWISNHKRVVYYLSERDLNLQVGMRHSNFFGSYPPCTSRLLSLDHGLCFDSSIKNRSRRAGLSTILQITDLDDRNRRSYGIIMLTGITYYHTQTNHHGSGYSSCKCKYGHWRHLVSLSISTLISC